MEKTRIDSFQGFTVEKVLMYVPHCLCKQELFVAT